ncbi:hypothetical protein, partial [Humibacter sp.]|uniref:hypothetical protein n=1 Tax=Humibacter sp. TaxID=1940291 RepID=UPI002C471757
EMWAEVTILGELAPRSEPITTWVWVTCPGGHECACRFINTQPDPQHPLAWWQRWLLRLVYLRPGAL